MNSLYRRVFLGRGELNYLTSSSSICTRLHPPACCCHTSSVQRIVQATAVWLTRSSSSLCRRHCPADHRGGGLQQQSRFYRVLAARQLLHDVTPGDRPDILEWIISGSGAGGCGVYAGFDPTADALHLGHLSVLVALLHTQRAGAHPLAVIGGSTAQLGDPSGRRKQRPSLPSDVIEQNAAGIEAIIRRVFDNHQHYIWPETAAAGGKKRRSLAAVKVLNNCEWYGEYSFVDFMTIVGRRFRIGRMLACSTVQSRLKVSENSRHGADGMTLAEFCYPMLQAYDWLYLWRRHGCRVQIGGSDQRTNMMAGYNLIGETASGSETAGIENYSGGDAETEPLAYCITVPLITNEEGDKLGKSSGNVLWLSSERTSPFDLFQYLVRTSDQEVESLLRKLTFLSTERIDDVIIKHKLDPGARNAQKLLAEQVTLLVHGPEALSSVERITEALYCRDSSRRLEALQQLEERELISMFRHSPPVSLSLPLAGEEPLTCRQMAIKAGCFTNESDADRIMQAGGFSINHARCTNGDQIVTPDEHILKSGLTLLRLGKKNYFLVKWV